MEAAGEKITRMMTNTTIDGITGPVIMNHNGDRLADYTILSMDPYTQIFQPVLAYSAQDKQLTSLSQIHWPGGCDNEVYRNTRSKKGGKCSHY